MAIVVYFPASDMTVAQYDAIVADLKAASAYPGAGCFSHACFSEGDKLAICDIWDSAESFKAFGETMMPLAVKHGVTMPDPFIAPAHHFYVTVHATP